PCWTERPRSGRGAGNILVIWRRHPEGHRNRYVRSTAARLAEAITRRLPDLACVEGGGGGGSRASGDRVIRSFKDSGRWMTWKELAARRTSLRSQPTQAEVRDAWSPRIRTRRSPPWSKLPCGGASGSRYS